MPDVNFEKAISGNEGKDVQVNSKIDKCRCQHTSSIDVSQHLFNKTVFFRCEVMNVNKAQKLELKKTHEEPILIKMGLSRIFPRKALCMRKSALGIGLIEASTMIDAIKFKLHVGSKQRMGNLGSLQ